MNNPFVQVKEFQDKLIGQTPSELTELTSGTEEAKHWGRLTVEQMKLSHENLVVMSSYGSKWMQARLILEELIELMEAEDVVDQIDALLDINYVSMGGVAQTGVDGQKLFDIVHNANMTKLFPDGKPRYDEQGKLIKPPHFVRPEEALKAELQRQKDQQG